MAANDEWRKSLTGKEQDAVLGLLRMRHEPHSQVQGIIRDLRPSSVSQATREVPATVMNGERPFKLSRRLSEVRDHLQGSGLGSAAANIPPVPAVPLSFARADEEDAVLTHENATEQSYARPRHIIEGPPFDSVMTPHRPGPCTVNNGERGNSRVSPRNQFGIPGSQISYIPVHLPPVSAINFHRIALVENPRQPTGVHSQSVEQNRADDNTVTDESDNERAYGRTVPISQDTQLESAQEELPRLENSRQTPNDSERIGQGSVLRSVLTSPIVPLSFTPAVTSNNVHMMKNLTPYVAFETASHVPPATVPSRGDNEQKNGRLAKKKEKRCNWTPEEVQILKNVVEIEGTDNWGRVALHLRRRTGKQCREKWNHFINSTKKSPWTAAEDAALLLEFGKVGKKWTEIASRISGRAPVDVKNRKIVLDRNKR